MSPLVVLGLLWVMTQHGAGTGAGNLIDQKTGPDALANLQHQKIAMSQVHTRDLTQTAFLTDWWKGPAPDGSGSVIYLVWASDDPTSWAVYSVHPGGRLPTELARGHGAQTNAVASALSRRIL